MGRRDRERIARIEAGQEEPFSEKARAVLGNVVARTAVKFASRGAVVKELSRGSVDDQTNRLSELVETGNLRDSKLRKAIMSKTPTEMDKGIRKFQKRGREVTVSGLLEEVRAEPGFLKMCERAGLDYAWFENLAHERIAAFGLEAK